jgi:hypothetical protein
VVAAQLAWQPTQESVADGEMWDAILKIEAARERKTTSPITDAAVAAGRERLKKLIAESPKQAPKKSASAMRAVLPPQATSRRFLDNGEVGRRP